MAERGDILVLRRAENNKKGLTEFVVTGGSAGVYELAPIDYPEHSQLCIGDEDLIYIDGRYCKVVEVRRKAGNHLLSPSHS